MQTEVVGARSAKRFIADFNKKMADKGLSEELASALETELAVALSPPATRFAIAAAALEVVEAIGNDRGRVLTVSGFSEGANAPDVALALPFIVGRAGIISKRLDVQIPFLKKVAESVAQQVQAMRSA
jgi:malate/lactate dehydrogenase